MSMRLFLEKIDTGISGRSKEDPPSLSVGGAPSNPLKQKGRGKTDLLSSRVGTPIFSCFWTIEFYVLWSSHSKTCTSNSSVSWSFNLRLSYTICSPSSQAFELGPSYTLVSSVLQLTSGSSWGLLSSRVTRVNSQRRYVCFVSPENPN